MHSIVELIKFGFVWDLNGIDIVDLFIYLFFFEEEDINIINQSWRNPPELHYRYVVKYHPSTR